MTSCFDELRVRTESDVTDMWHLILGDPGVAQSTLFLAMIGESGRVSPDVIVVNDNAEVPDAEVLANLASRTRDAMNARAPRGTLAVLWARPGIGAMRDSDRLWLRLLARAMRAAGVACWPAHYATDAYLRIVAADDLAA